MYRNRYAISKISSISSVYEFSSNLHQKILSDIEQLLSVTDHSTLALLNDFWLETCERKKDIGN